MTAKTPTATGRTTADQPTTQARPQGTHIRQIRAFASCLRARAGLNRMPMAAVRIGGHLGGIRPDRR